MIHELLHILADPAHWVAEVVMDGTIMLVVAYPFRRLVARHDRRTHKIDKPSRTELLRRLDEDDKPEVEPQRRTMPVDNDDHDDYVHSVLFGHLDDEDD